MDTALEISGNTWKDAFNAPGTAWEKIEKLSANIVKIALTEESSLYSLIMVQAVTQGKTIPGLMEHIMQGLSYSYGFLPLIIEAQHSGEAAQGDPQMLMMTYIALVQGLVLLACNDDEMKKNITPEIFTNVLRNTGKSPGGPADVRPDPVTMAITVIPLSPGGAGLPELLYISFFTQYVPGDAWDDQIAAGVMLVRGFPLLVSTRLQPW